MNGVLHGAWKIGTVMGIPVRVHYSWLIVFGLITWSLSTFYFPQAAPDLPAASYWIKGILAALLLFISVGFHELSHSLVAKKYGISIESITLFIFGGVAQMRGEPPHPKAEFRIALAGPLASFLLSAVFFFVSLNTAHGVKAFFAYLAQINLIIGLFNLIPGFPMDGGRVLRSIIWEKKKDYFYATKKAASIGQKIAIFFIIFGIFSVFAGMPGGLWLMLIGWFIYTAAQASYQQSTLQETLSGMKVADIMVRDIVTITPSITLEEALNNYFLRNGYGGFPVVDGGKYLGILSLKELKKIPRDAFRSTRVADVFLPHSRQWEISRDDTVISALETMIREDMGRLVVLEGDSISGLITRNGIARYLQIMGKQA